MWVVPSTGRGGDHIGGVRSLRKKGEKVTIPAPRGPLNYQIMKIEAEH